MTQRKQGIKLLVSSLLLAIVLYIAYQFIVAPLIPTLSDWITRQRESQTLQQQISSGGKILVLADTNDNKQAGVQAFAQRDFTTAYNQFHSSVQTHLNDPETLIYRNNADAIVRNSSSLKITVSVPIGSNLNVAKEILRGVAMAQVEVNRGGGIDSGKLLLVEIANDNNNPALAQRLANHFVTDSNVLAVVGHNASDASVAACRVYQQGKLVMISPTSFSQELSDCGDHIFRTTSVRVLADQLADYALKTARKTNIAVCFDRQAKDNRWFMIEFTSAIYAYKGKFINTGCDFSAPDFNPSTALSRAISAGADSLLLAPHVDRINKALEVALENKGRLVLFGSPTLYTFQTLQSGQADVNGLVLAVPWHPAADDPFVIDAKILWGGPVNWRTAMAYDATKAIAKGLQQSNTRDGLQKALSSPSFSALGATGTIQFLPSGERNGAAVLVQVQPGDISGTDYDFVSLSPR